MISDKSKLSSSEGRAKDFIDNLLKQDANEINPRGVDTFNTKYPRYHNTIVEAVADGKVSAMQARHTAEFVDFQKGKDINSWEISDLTSYVDVLQKRGTKLNVEIADKKAPDGFRVEEQLRTNDAHNEMTGIKNYITWALTNKVADGSKIPWAVKGSRESVTFNTEVWRDMIHAFEEKITTVKNQFLGTAQELSLIHISEPTRPY